MTVVSFKDYLPPARFDGLPWTQIRIDEAPLATGPWNLIDTIAISPVDTNTAEPNTRNFTTDNATLTEGWYRVSFVDAAATVVRTEPVQNIEEVEAEYQPMLSEVGGLLRSRTVDSDGVAQGTFTNKTKPTGSQAELLIDQAQGDLELAVGGDIPDRLIPSANRLVALRTAMYIELSFYSEQVKAGLSPYPEYKEIWDELMPQFIERVSDAEAVDGSDDTTGDAGMAQFNFPTNAGGLIGWGTKW